MYNKLRLDIIKNSLYQFFIFFLLVIISKSHGFAPFQKEDKIMKVPIYFVDAFTEKIFSGNPAAVCPLSEWLDDDLHTRIIKFVDEGEGF